MTTPYRNEVDALRDRKESLETEIARLRAGLEPLKSQESELTKELARVEASLKSHGATKRALPLLDEVRVASPCKANWDDMVGDARVRFCLQCDKNVYNLSEMKREDAEALLRERMGSELCVRFYQRADGTILTQDCPVGVTKKRRRRVALAVAGAGAMAFAAASTMMTRTMGARRITTGEIAVQGAAPVQTDVPQVMGSVVYPEPVPPVVDPPQPKTMGRVAHPIKK